MVVLIKHLLTRKRYGAIWHRTWLKETELTELIFSAVFPWISCVNWPVVQQSLEAKLGSKRSICLKMANHHRDYLQVHNLVKHLEYLFMSQLLSAFSWFKCFLTIFLLAMRLLFSSRSSSSGECSVNFAVGSSCSLHLLPIRVVHEGEVHHDAVC